MAICQLALGETTDDAFETVRDGNAIVAISGHEHVRWSPRPPKRPLVTPLTEGDPAVPYLVTK